MAERRITSQDVADLAGVSRTTVSFVLNNDIRFSIRPETQQKVHEAAAKLGYVPNASARALASNQAKAIGLIMTRDTRYISSDIFLPQLIGGLLDSVKLFGISLLIEWVEPGQQLQTYHKLTRAKHIDGMILTISRYDDTGLKVLEDSDIPVVLMGTVPHCKLNSVDIDNAGSAQKAVDHLLKLGHKQIACITDAPLPYSSASQRLSGYQQALQSAGIGYDEALVRYGDFDAESGYKAMQSLLKSKTEFSALFAASDNISFGAMEAVREAGLEIPGDISFVGHDDIPLARFAQPPLTTVRVPTAEIAKQSCQLLLELLIDNGSPKRNILLETELIVRDSTKEKEGTN
ncbi:MAG TPA: LacI family DNA-binding transcriptional regulator [Anaerolineaceae bacterium]|nr:LacI family DNA-binding transcriptional regulator [Anaerolineaceae bacterium]